MSERMKSDLNKDGIGLRQWFPNTGWKLSKGLEDESDGCWDV